MFKNYMNSEIRELCRTAIETLEIWLRRLIDQQLQGPFGADYLHYKDESGEYIVKKSVREGVLSRRNSEPKRYPRDIDAVVLDDSVSILLHPKLYKDYFREPLLFVFPIGKEMGKVIFEKVIETRNYLAHANHISSRQAEQIICYSHDIIDSIKEYYEKIGVEKLYNVPSIIQVSDSLGNIKYESEINNSRNDVSASFVLNKQDNKSLRPGDVLSIEVEIDPTFTEDQYNIRWFVQDRGSSINDTEKRFEIKIRNSHVGERFVIECAVTSNKQWHRYGLNDDRIMLMYRVLPPNESGVII